MVHQKRRINSHKERNEEYTKKKKKKEAKGPSMMLGRFCSWVVSEYNLLKISRYKEVS